MQDEPASGNSEQKKPLGETGKGPRSGAPAPPAGLPCLKKNNCTKVGAPRSVFVAQENIRLYVEEFGENNIGLLTVTTPSECLGAGDFQKKWHSFRTHVITEYFPTGMWTRERQPRTGNWHAHAVVNVGWDIKTGFPFDQVKSRFYANVDPRIRDLWKILRDGAESHGFGRTELLPLKVSGPAAARYLVKYLTKTMEVTESEDERRTRRFGVWGGVRFVRTPFSFVRSRIIRKRKAWLAAEFGITNNEGFKAMLGPHWWFHISPTLLQVIMPEDYYKIPMNGELVWDDIGFRAYLENIEGYPGAASLEDAALDSQFWLFYEVGKILFWPSTEQAMDFAMSRIARRREEVKKINPQSLLDFRGDKLGA